MSGRPVVVRMYSTLLWTSACLLSAAQPLAQAAQRTWTGLGADSGWATSANWDSGVPTASDIVLFSGAGNGKNALTLGTGATAAALSFAPDAAAYTVGIASQTLTLPASATLTLAAGSANNQSIPAMLLVSGDLNIYNNELSKILTLNYTNNANRIIYVYGNGPVTFDTLRRPAGSELSNNNTVELQLRSSATVTCTGPISLGDLWKDSNYQPSELILAPHTTNIICRDNWDFALSGCTISGGEGTVLRLARPTAGIPAAIAVQTANPNTISCRLECPSGLATLNAGAGGWTGGTLILSYSDNLISNAVTIDRGNCFQVPFLALNGTPNPLGACTNVNFTNPLSGTTYARLRVTGSSASASDKTFTVDKDYGVIENAGSGVLTLSGLFVGAGTFIFDAAGDITLSGVRSGTGGILKTGAGKLTLTAVNTHTGTNTINGGTLALPVGASLGSGVLVLSGGTLSLNPGVSDGYSVTLPATLLSDSSSLVIPDAATSSSVTLSSLALNGCVLSVSAPSAGTVSNRIFVTGLADGAVSNVVLNGGLATYTAANGLAPRTLTSVAVTNDTLPNAAGSAATADTAPAASFSLAQPLTALGQFNYTAASPATLDLGGGILALDSLSTKKLLSVVNGTLTASGASANITYAGLRTVRIVPLTSDAATGISSSKTYTHLIDFGNQSAATINGVTFTKGGATGTGTGYSGFPNGNAYIGWNSWTNSLPPETCSGLRALLYDMNYAGNFTAQVTGLTPGAIYEITLYFRAWDAPPSTQERRSLYQFYSTSSSFPDTSVIYASQPNSANAIVYRYMAPASGTLKFAVTAVATSGNTASGCFGFVNEQLAAAAATPPASGSICLAGPLAISAALADNGAPTALTVPGADALTLSGPVSLTGSAHFDVPLTLAPGSSVTQAFNGPVSSSASIALNGAGRVVFNAANPALSGPVVVSNGVLEIANSQSLGASAQPTVTVEAGGSLAVGQAANSSVALTKNVTVAGNGPDGLGALRFDYDNLQNYAFQSIALSSDASVGGTAPLYLPYAGTRGRFDLRSGTLDFGGHTLSKVGSSSFILAASRTLGVTPSTAIDVKGGVLGLETTTILQGSATNTLTVRDGAVLDLYQVYFPIGWSVSFGNQAHFSSRYHSATNQNLLAGPVTLLGTTILDGAYFDTIAGAISGTGGLFKAQGYTRLSAITNTYSGATVVTNGVLYALADTSLSAGNYSRVSVVSNGVLVIRPANAAASQPGWSDSNIGSLATVGSFARTASLGFETVYADHAYAGSLPVTGIAKYGSKKETLSGSGDLGPITVNEGELYFASGTRNIGTNSIIVGPDSSITSVSTVHVANAASLLASDYGYNRSGPLVSLAAANATRAVLCLDDGGAVAGRLYLGNGANNAQGAVYQSGGTFLNTAGASNDGRLGASGFGYYEISGGTFTTKGNTQLGYNTNTVGIIRQTGGAIVFNSGTTPSTGVIADYYGGNFAVRAGYGLFNLAGGTFNTGANKLTLGEYDSIFTYSNGVGVLTMENDAYASAYYLEMANRNGSPLSVANLNGGTLAVRYLVKGGNNSNGTNATALVSFNGGNLRLTDGGAAVRTGTYNTAPVLALCTNGASIEVDAAATVTLDLPLAPPQGYGVTYIGTNTIGAGYIAPPFVNISGGGGTGATAIASINRTTGQLSDIRVTSPGFGYTNAPTVTLMGGGYTTTATVKDITVGLTPATGGLTKRGNGQLVLTTNNTFRGAVTVAGGILAARAPAAIPQGANLVLNGGTLDLGGYTLTNSAVTLAGGSLINGTVVTTTLNKNDAGAADLSANITLASVAVNAANGTPGLYEGRVTNYLNRTEANPRWSIQLTTRAFNVTNAASGGTINGCLWPDNTCYVYSGYLWNRSGTNVTWTFGENFDDTAYLVIDGSTILNESNSAIPSYRNVVLTPGPHAIEVRCGQNSGTVGGNWVYSNSTYRVGFGVDFQGRAQNIANNYQPLTDPGDGSLLTVDLPACYTSAVVASATNLPSLPSEVAANVGSLASGYALVYASDIPSSGGVINGSVAGTRYSTDNSMSNTNDFDRVAYYVELTHPTYGNQWVWVSFDAVTRDRSRIGYPWHDFTAGTNYCANVFQRKVSNMDVRSNVATITNYVGCATGNIEFWPNDYGTNDVPSLGLGASSSTFDFGDTMSSAPLSLPSHGSFQVHNWGDKTTLFAMDNWGKANNTLSLGIGNQPSGNPDWTFNYNGAAYTYRRLYVFTHDIIRKAPSTSANVSSGTLRLAPATITHPVPAAIRAKVGSAADNYDVVYGSAVPTFADTIYSGTAYGIDNSSATDAFDRVAYYLELVDSSAVTQYVWVAFNPQTTDRKKLGYPSQFTNRFMWQQKITNMDVVCNVSGVINYTGSSTGNIEIWPSNYGPGISGLGLGGSTTTYDYDDSGASTVPGHGCFQIHNWGDKTTLLAISHCGTNGNAIGVGIGNNPKITNNDPDYTFTYNATQYVARTFYVMVRPTNRSTGAALATTDLTLASGAALDLGGATQAIQSVTGSGTILNGTLAANTVVSPAGDGAVGTNAFVNVQFASGVQYHADLGDLLDMTGSLNLTGMHIRINNPVELSYSQSYTLIRTTAGITGTATLDTALPSGWKLLQRGNDLLLFAESGTLIKIR